MTLVAAVSACGEQEAGSTEPDRDPLPPGAYEDTPLCRGGYPDTQLAEWFAGGKEVLSVEGTVFFDHDEVVSCLRVGVATRTAGRQVVAMLPQLGIPRDAVIIEFAEPIRPL